MSKSYSPDFCIGKLLCPWGGIGIIRDHFIWQAGIIPAISSTKGLRPGFPEGRPGRSREEGFLNFDPGLPQEGPAIGHPYQKDQCMISTSIRTEGSANDAKARTRRRTSDSDLLSRT